MYHIYLKNTNISGPKEIFENSKHNFFSHTDCTLSPGERTPSSCPVKKDGTPDTRKSNKSPQAKIPSSGCVASPVKRDDKSDMSFSVNEQPSSLVASSQTSNPDKQSASPSSYCSYGVNSLSHLSSHSTPSGPVKKDGTPDMRYAVNRSAYLSSGAVGACYSYGPLKKDGTPDMRFAANRSAYLSRGAVGASFSCGPLKKDGTPDMRYAANRSGYGSSSRGPLKKDGTPDMRFKANWR